MKKLLTLITIIITFSLSAQVIPSPDAAKLIRDVNVPVNYYNGVASVSVPLYEAKANNGFTVPVSLQYNTGGIKVKDISGVAGLGWNLLAGGAITRIVRDKPDEQNRYKSTVDESSIWGYVNGWADFETDLFYFSYPGGSGRFILKEVNRLGDDAFVWDPEWYPIALPKNDMKIQFLEDGDDHYFVFTDLSGNKYYFGDTSASREETVANVREHTTGSLPAYDPENERTFTSTWHLSKIVFADQPVDKGINFSYTSGGTVVEESKSRRALALYWVDYFQCIENCTDDNDCNDCATEDYTFTAYSKTSISTKHVSQISFPQGTISFGYGNREDHAVAKRLNSIELKDHNNVIVSKTSLNHTYFNSSDSFFKGGIYGTCNSRVCKRLKLNSVVRDGSTIRSFDYSNNKETYPGTSIDIYELPPRDSYYVDHWGYYNGDLNFSGTLYLWNPSYQGQYVTLKGMSRSPRSSALSNILTKVNYPTGGYTALEYGHNQKHGGVRIESIKTFDSDEELVSGQSFIYNPADENDVIKPVYLGYSITSGGANTSAIFEFDITQTLNLNGNQPGYQKMEVVDLMNGFRVRYHFKNMDHSDRQTIKASKTLYRHHDGNFTPIAPYPSHIDLESYPYVSNSLEFYDLGQPELVEYMDSDGTKIREEEFVYEHVNNSSKIENNSIVPLRYVFNTADGERPEYIVSNYYIKLSNLRLLNKIDRSFENGLVSEVTTTNTYNPTYATLPKTITIERSDASGGESFDSKRMIYYPFEWPFPASELVPSNGVLQEMVNKHMIGIPVSTENRVKLPAYSSYKTANVSLTTFQKPHGLIHPHKTYNLVTKLPGAWDYTDMDLISTQSYNSSGLLSSVIGRDDIETTYGYDPQGYLTSKTIKPDPNDDSMDQTTTYTYKDLVGVETVTGPTLEKITYEYDSRNRLHLIRDNENNIVERYRYNYGNEINELSAEIVINGPILKNTSQNIRAKNIEAYGEVDVKWYDDQGTLLSTNKNFNHTFSGPGSKTIRLVLISPEHDAPFNDEVSKTFYNEWSVGTISGNGTECRAEGELEEPGGGTGGSAVPEYYAFVSPGGTTCGDLASGFSYQWQHNQSGGWASFGNNSPSAEIPNYLKISTGTFKIKVLVTSNCGTKSSPEKTITIENCGSGGGTGGGGTGGGGPTSTCEMAGCSWDPVDGRCEDASGFPCPE